MALIDTARLPVRVETRVSRHIPKSILISRIFRCLSEG